LKVYVVTAGEYSSYRIEAIFTEREKAVAYAAIHSSQYKSLCIEPYETWDDVVSEGKDVFRVYIDDGQFTVRKLPESAFANRGFNFYKEMFVRQYPVKAKDPEGNLLTIGYKRCIDVVAKDKAHALKIAQDKWAEHKAQKAGI